MTVYADEAFLLNGAVDYLLLVCAAKLGGGRILRLRLALAAAFALLFSFVRSRWRRRSAACTPRRRCSRRWRFCSSCR